MRKLLQDTDPVFLPLSHPTIDGLPDGNPCIFNAWQYYGVV